MCRCFSPDESTEELWQFLSFMRQLSSAVPDDLTGGGSIFAQQGDSLPIGTRVTHGLQLHRDTNQKNPNLEINWSGGNNFHLDKVTSVTCYDDPLINPPPPLGTVIDTYAGTALFNGHTGYHGFGY